MRLPSSNEVKVSDQDISSGEISPINENMITEERTEEGNSPAVIKKTNISSTSSESLSGVPSPNEKSIDKVLIIQEQIDK